MRLIDADAFLDDVMERHCKDCDRRKGIKNGKWRIIYEVGEAPCRACSVDDMKCEIEDLPTAIDLVRCKDCKHWQCDDDESYCDELGIFNTDMNSYCSYGKRRKE